MKILVVSSIIQVAWVTYVGSRGNFDCTILLLTDSGVVLTTYGE